MSLDRRLRSLEKEFMIEAPSPDDIEFFAVVISEPQPGWEGREYYAWLTAPAGYFGNYGADYLNRLAAKGREVVVLFNGDTYPVDYFNGGGCVAWTDADCIAWQSYTPGECMRKVMAREILGQHKETHNG